MTGDTLETVLAQAIANAFWETAEQPRHWSTMGQNQREVFQICARRAIEAATEFKAKASRSQPSGVRPSDGTGTKSRASMEGAHNDNHFRI